MPSPAGRPPLPARPASAPAAADAIQVGSDAAGSAGWSPVESGETSSFCRTPGGKLSLYIQEQRLSEPLLRVPREGSGYDLHPGTPPSFCRLFPGDANPFLEEPLSQASEEWPPPQLDTPTLGGGEQAQCLLPGLVARRQRWRPPSMTEFAASPPGIRTAECSPATLEGALAPPGPRRPRSLNLATPSSCSSLSYRHALTPGTPDPFRSELKLVTGDIGAVLFDFDGTLTASPGDTAQRCRKQAELRDRAPMLAPRLRALRDAGLILGIISKSSELTICTALREAGLTELFDGPVLAKAVGLEGKVGFIEEMVVGGDLRHLGPEGLRRVLLVDDDVRELDRARTRGVQTYAAPKEGGLQEGDFDEIFAAIGVRVDFSRAPSPLSARSSAAPSPPTVPRSRPPTAE